MSHALHTGSIVIAQEFQFICNHLVEKINRDRLEFPIDAIAVRGVSGIAVGGAVSFLTGIPLVIVRKPEEKNHSAREVEYSVKFNHFIVIDDLVSSGSTINKINAACLTERPFAVFEKFYTYRYGDEGSIKSDAFYNKFIKRWYGFRVQNQNNRVSIYEEYNWRRDA